MSQPKRFLCPVDFSDISVKAARYAAELAASLGGTVKLLYVYHAPLHSTALAAPRHFADLSPEQLSELEKSLAALQRELAKTGASVQTGLAVGAPAEQVVEIAKAESTDMIVIGSQGHSRVAQLLLGSVAERVLRLSPVPVLVVPA